MFFVGRPYPRECVRMYFLPIKSMKSITIQSKMSTTAVMNMTWAHLEDSSVMMIIIICLGAVMMWIRTRQTTTGFRFLGYIHRRLRSMTAGICSLWKLPIQSLQITSSWKSTISFSCCLDIHACPNIPESCSRDNT